MAKQRTKKQLRQDNEAELANLLEAYQTARALHFGLVQQAEKAGHTAWEVRQCIEQLQKKLGLPRTLPID